MAIFLNKGNQQDVEIKNNRCSEWDLIEKEESCVSFWRKRDQS